MSGLLDLACRRAKHLVAQRTAGLSAGEQLWLETHLEGCAECRRDADHLEQIASLARAQRAVRVRTPRHDRAIAEALRRAASAPAAPVETGPRPAAWPIALGVGSVAATAAAATVLALAWPAEPPAIAEKTVAEASWAPAAQAAGPVEVPRPPATDERPTSAAASTALAVSRVVAEDGARYQWGNSEVSLGEGTLDVGPGDGEVSVVTGTFRTIILSSSSARVSPRVVTVRDGIVRVETLDGEILEVLGPGRRWEAPERPAHGAAPAELLLRHARVELAAGDVASARRHLAEAARVASRVSERAEAETLRAEVALVSGDTERAVRLYLRVADRYRRSPAGESALFAAARLEGRRGATRLFQAYLDRFPNGRFREEARYQRRPGARPCPPLGVSVAVVPWAA